MRWALPLLFALLATGASAQATLRVGAKNFTESAVLAELMAQLIEAQTDLSVERSKNLGGTMICWQALAAGEIDLYAEYTGTGWATILGRQQRLTDALRTYLEVRTRFLERHDVHWLSPFGFENAYALAMPEALADELGVKRISDLAAHQQTVRVGVGHEFKGRPDGYDRLLATYGLEFPQLRLLEHGLAYEAVQSGAIDLMDAYTTDGKLLRFGLRVLDDDRGFFPPYDAAPIVRGAVLERHPEVAAVLDRLAFRITTRDAQAMNFLVEAGGHGDAAVARAMLESLQLVSDTDPAIADVRRRLDELRRSDEPPVASAEQRPGFFELLGSQYGRLSWLVLEHLGLTALAILLATMLAVPLGIVLRRHQRTRKVVLSITGVVQTIPSLALLALMIPLFGLDVQAAIAALFLYALLPILRNTCTGLDGVPADLVDAARGMGMRPREILRHVQLPLALPTIMAGIRTSAVIGIGVATLVAYIGAGGLGGPIFSGLSLNDTAQILLGALPAAGLAILADFLLGLLERRLRPAGHVE